MGSFIKLPGSQKIPIRPIHSLAHHRPQPIITNPSQKPNKNEGTPNPRTRWGLLILHSEIALTNPKSKTPSLRSLCNIKRELHRRVRSSLFSLRRTTPLFFLLHLGFCICICTNGKQTPHLSLSLDLFSISVSICVWCFYISLCCVLKMG